MVINIIMGQIIYLELSNFNMDSFMEFFINSSKFNSHYYLIIQTFVLIKYFLFLIHQHFLIILLLFYLLL